MSVIKMSDIAKMANVSPTTVARVLHNRGYVSGDKRRQIEKIIDELGYVPNKVAQGLKKNSNNIIGHVIPSSSTNPFFAMMDDAISNAAGTLGYHVLTVVAKGDEQNKRMLIEDLVSHMVEAIFFTSTTPEPDLVEWLVRIGIPVIMIERPINVSGIDRVLINNAEGSSIATSHILSKGHRRIAYVGRDTNYNVEIERYEGYRDTLQRSKIDIPPDYVRFTPGYTEECGYQAVKEIFESKNPPTAIFVSSDLLAAGAMQYLYEKSLRIPEDISLVGYDDTVAGILSPPITSVVLPMQEIGKITIQMMNERKTENRKTSKTVILSPSLVDRGSVKAI